MYSTKFILNKVFISWTNYNDKIKSQQNKIQILINDKQLSIQNIISINIHVIIVRIRDKITVMRLSLIFPQ